MYKLYSQQNNQIGTCELWAVVKNKKNDLILSTTTGGLSWDSQRIKTNDNLVGFHFFNQFNGIAVTGTQQVFKTRSGGFNYVKGTSPFVSTK